MYCIGIEMSGDGGNSWHEMYMKTQIHSLAEADIWDMFVANQ
jgi:hypothetical protein